MNRRAFVVALLAVVACGGRGKPEPYKTELTAPWASMGLPVGEGRVVYSDDLLLTVHYDGGEVGALTTAWSTALESAGLARKADTSAQDMTSITWSNDSAVVALGVLSGEGRAEVSLTRYPK